MIADRIKFLREEKNYTQTELARRLGITRSSVNAWEQGISVPSTQYVVELSRIFAVSTDYLLGVDHSASIDVSGMSEEDLQLVYHIVRYLRDDRHSL